MIARIREKGIETCELTLDVGLGTFQPIHSESLEEHEMHSEALRNSDDNSGKTISEARATRTSDRLQLERLWFAPWKTSAQQACQPGRRANLLSPADPKLASSLRPGYDFRVVDVLLTNFHLPRSTLLALVCAFAGREQVLGGIPARHRKRLPVLQLRRLHADSLKTSADLIR